MFVSVFSRSLALCSRQFLWRIFGFRRCNQQHIPHQRAVDCASVGRPVCRSHRRAWCVPRLRCVLVLVLAELMCGWCVCFGVGQGAVFFTLDASSGFLSNTNMYFVYDRKPFCSLSVLRVCLFSTFFPHSSADHLAESELVLLWYSGLCHRAFVWPKRDTAHRFVSCIPRFLISCVQMARP